MSYEDLARRRCRPSRTPTSPGRPKPWWPWRSRRSCRPIPASRRRRPWRPSVGSPRRRSRRHRRREQRMRRMQRMRRHFSMNRLIWLNMVYQVSPCFSIFSKCKCGHPSATECNGVQRHDSIKLHGRRWTSLLHQLKRPACNLKRRRWLRTETTDTERTLNGHWTDLRILCMLC